MGGWGGDLGGDSGGVLGPRRPRFGVGDRDGLSDTFLSLPSANVGTFSDGDRSLLLFVTVSLLRLRCSTSGGATQVQNNVSKG